MPRRTYIVRLYSTHDSDLIFYAFTHDVDLIVVLYVALHAYIRGDRFTLDSPAINKPIPPSLRRRYSLQLRLDEKKDNDLIQVLDSIQSGYRNIFFRNILRLYLNAPLHPHQLNNSGDKNVFDSFNNSLRARTKLVMLNPASNRFREKRRVIDGDAIDSTEKKITNKNTVTEIPSSTSKDADRKPNEPESTAVEKIDSASEKNSGYEPRPPIQELDYKQPSVPEQNESSSMDDTLFDELLDMLGQ